MNSGEFEPYDPLEHYSFTVDRMFITIRDTMRVYHAILERADAHIRVAELAASLRMITQNYKKPTGESSNRSRYYHD